MTRIPARHAVDIFDLAIRNGHFHESYRLQVRKKKLTTCVLASAARRVLRKAPIDWVLGSGLIRLTDDELWHCPSSVTARIQWDSCPMLDRSADASISQCSVSIWPPIGAYMLFPACPRD